MVKGRVKGIIAMVSRRVIRFVNDIDNTELPEGEAKNVRFGIDGTHYEIDLTAAHASQLRAALAPYATVGHRVGTARKPFPAARPAKIDAAQLSAIRRWARAHGYELSNFGRIPAHIHEAYQTNL